MDYEKAYKEALERARKLTSDMTTLQKIREFIFPEFRDSEDERIRSALLRGFNSMLANQPVGTFYGERIKDILAYLEKQKEQKPAGLPPGFYFIDLDGNRYYSKEFRYGDMKMKVVEKEQKPAEWSEEDEKRVKQLIYDTEHIRAEYEKRKKELGESFNDDLIKDCDEQIAWLKSLRPRPQWKPSEEQMKALQ